MGESKPFRHLLVIEEPNQETRTIVLEENTYSLGRSLSNSITLLSRMVSRHHATLLRVHYADQPQDVFWVIDGDLQGNRSANGVFVNGKRCLSYELESEDAIFFGSEVKATFKVVNSAYITLTNTLAQHTQDQGHHKDPRQLAPEDEFDQNVTRIPHGVLQPLDNLNPEILCLLTNQPDSLSEPVIEMDFAGNFTFVNAAAEKRFPDLNRLQKNHPALAGILSSSTERTDQLFVRRIRLEPCVYEQYVHYLSSSQRIRSYFFDFTQRKNVETALQESEARYHSVIKQISEGIFLVDVATKEILEANPAYCRLLGYSQSEILELTLYKVIALDREIVDTELARIVGRRLNLVVESVHCRKDASPVNVEVSISPIQYDGREVLCFAVRDITKRKQAEAMLRYHAFHDLMTGLPNRVLFKEQLTVAIANAAKNSISMGVMFLDLDRFKNINDSLGHAVGDQLLQNVAQRIHACLSAKDSVARWGGDEFTILLPQINSAEDPTKVAKDILTSLKEPFPLDNLQLRIRASIGISLFPQDGHDAETLIKHADAALYRTKENGRNNYSFYRPNMTSIASNLLKLENLLHQAIEEKQLSLYYQPQINVTTGQVFGMEALLRWHHPDLGAVSPARFIPLAEETNLIIPIGEWVLKTACAQSREWQQAGLPNLRVAVNLSPLQFQQANLVEMIAQNLANTNLTSDYLEVEVTETTLMQNVDFARQVLHELQDMGIQISMDDFGTGYSSLSYLKNLPFHAIKIDQSFIRDLKNAPQDKAIISAIIALGRGFELRVIAEGVETPEQMELLRSLHCNEMQGYWFSHPLPPAEATAFLLRQQQCQTQPLRTVENADESMSAPPGWEAIH